MNLENLLVESVELLNRIFRYDEAILVQNRLVWIVDHFSLNVLGKRVIGFSLSKDIHLLGDDLDILNVS